MDKEKAKKNLKTIVDRLHNDTDFVLLKEYKKLFKKEIFLFNRTEIAAWLFMYYDQREIPREKSAASPENKPRGAEKFATQLHTRSDKFIKPAAADRQPIEINLSEEESKRLFISIGKNRKLFPREVISLIMSKTSTPREDIGLIRILDNYSFVQVRDTRADEIINAITGVKFRGRTLTVNYAKPKAEEN